MCIKIASMQEGSRIRCHHHGMLSVRQILSIPEFANMELLYPFDSLNAMIATKTDASAHYNESHTLWLTKNTHTFTNPVPLSHTMPGMSSKALVAMVDLCSLARGK